MHACSAEPGRTTAYSPDIGWRVVWQRLGMEYTYEQIGRWLQIAPSTAHRIFSRFKSTGDVAPREQPSRECLRKLDHHHELLIMVIVCENPCLYLREICQLIYETTSVVVSGSIVCRTLQRLGYTRKKVQQIARQRCQGFRGAFWPKYCNFLGISLCELTKLVVIYALISDSLVIHYLVSHHNIHNFLHVVIEYQQFVQCQQKAWLV